MHSGLVVIPLAGAVHTISSNRLFELRDRVHRGALYIKTMCVTSAWMAEIFGDPHFTVGYLDFRSRMKEDSFFVHLYDQLRNRPSSPARYSSAVFFGLDIELSCVSQALHYRVMDQLWRSEAERMLHIVTESR
jgi:hypothetical protein